MHGVYEHKLFEGYGGEVAIGLREFLDEQPGYDMYGMMRYFFGFADEKLQSIDIYAGKKFRSSLCLLIADLYGAKDAALHAALSLEMFHNFTLIHDDIEDHDELRRGRKTVWSIWGINHGINTGDAQAILAYRLLTSGAAADPERGIPVADFLMQKYQEVIEGQFLDFTLTDLPIDHPDVHADAYFAMIARKTAALIGAAARAPAMLAGLSEKECSQLWEYGYNLGIAYQLCDDTVSIWGEKAKTAKILAKRASGSYAIHWLKRSKRAFSALSPSQVVQTKSSAPAFIPSSIFF